MKNSFLVNIVLLLCINVLIKPAYIFAVEIPVQNEVGNDVYGMYFTFLNLAYIFQLVSDMGLQNLTYTELPRNRSSFPSLFSNILALRLGLGLLFVSAISLAGYVLGYWALNPELFAVVMCNVLLVSFLQYIRSNISGLGYYFKDSIVSVTDKLIMLLVLVYLLYYQDTSTFTIFSFVYVQTLAYVIAIICGIAMLGSHLSFVKPNLKAMKALLRQALPYGVVIVLMFLYTRLDAIMIEKMMADGLVEAGRYASAYRLYDAAAMLTFLFAGLLLPMFSELDHDREVRKRLYYGSLSMICVLAVLVALPVIFLRSFVMETLYTDVTATSVSALAILMAAFVLKSSLFVTSTLLTAARAFREMIILFTTSILLNIAINYVLIPINGIAGASFATFITQFYVAIGCVYVCHRTGLIRGDGHRYLGMAAFIGCAVLAFVGVDLLFDFSGFPLYAIYTVLLLGVLYIGLNFKYITQLSQRLGRQ